MRIVTGRAKGRAIKAPEGMNTRPTSDRVKESIFNIISTRMYDSNCLDVFAGTGNLGLEAISRGAKYCTFIEKDKNTYKILRENIETLKFEKDCVTYNQDAFNVLKLIEKKGEKYDIIFLDPPYSKGLIDKSIEEISTLDILKGDGVIISEYDDKDIIPDKIGDIRVYRTEKYGRTKVSFWSKED